MRRSRSLEDLAPPCHTAVLRPVTNAAATPAEAVAAKRALPAPAGGGGGGHGRQSAPANSNSLSWLQVRTLSELLLPASPRPSYTGK